MVKETEKMVKATKYECEKCHVLYNTREEAEKCENQTPTRSFAVEMNDLVVFNHWNNETDEWEGCLGRVIYFGSVKHLQLPKVKLLDHYDPDGANVLYLEPKHSRDVEVITAERAKALIRAQIEPLTKRVAQLTSVMNSL